MASHEPAKDKPDGVDGMLEMTSRFMVEAANVPAPSRPIRRVLWVVLAVIGALVVLGWIALLSGD